MNQLGDEINISVLKIASQVEETESEFIFRFLSDFAHSTYQVVIEKEELFKAIQLIRMSNNDAGDALFFNDANNIRVDSDDLLGLTINVLNYYRERFNKTKDKRYWWQMIQLLPSSYNQTRNVMMNYEVLANIYRSRRCHKLDCWREFCDFVETLPYSELITGE